MNVTQTRADVTPRMRETTPFHSSFIAALSISVYLRPRDDAGSVTSKHCKWVDTSALRPSLSSDAPEQHVFGRERKRIGALSCCPRDLAASWPRRLAERAIGINGSLCSPSPTDTPFQSSPAGALHSHHTHGGRLGGARAYTKHKRVDDVDP